MTQHPIQPIEEQLDEILDRFEENSSDLSDMSYDDARTEAKSKLLSMLREARKDEITKAKDFNKTIHGEPVNPYIETYLAERLKQLSQEESIQRKNGGLK